MPPRTQHHCSDLAPDLSQRSHLSLSSLSLPSCFTWDLKATGRVGESRIFRNAMKTSTRSWQHTAAAGILHQGTSPKEGLISPFQGQFNQRCSQVNSLLEAHCLAQGSFFTFIFLSFLSISPSFYCLSFVSQHNYPAPDFLNTDTVHDLKLSRIYYGRHVSNLHSISRLHLAKLREGK